MKDNLRMDSHKLIYHPERVAIWLDNEEVYPLEVEISPSGACNHRCTFCAVDYLGYSPDFLDKEITLSTIKQMAENGLKSVICSGEGEPLLNKNLPQMVNTMKSYGVDVAMSSNAVLFTESVAKECLESLTWVRFSIASMEEESYQIIHRGKKGDLKKVKSNLKDIIKVKRERNLKTTIGVQCLLIPQNAVQVADMAKQLKEIGVDYFTIKPYSQHLHSDNHFEVDYKEQLNIEEELKEYNTENFQVIFRVNAMEKIHQKKNYEHCLGLPFMIHIDAKGNVWPCVAHIGTYDFCYGNIYEESFEKMWNGKRRKAVIDRINALDINQICRESCRLDEINKYLAELKNPCQHVNFI